MFGRKLEMLLEVSREAKRPLLVGTVILVFLSIFTKCQASSPFEAMNSAHLSMCQKDVRPSVQKWWRTMSFSRDSTVTSLNKPEFQMSIRAVTRNIHQVPVATRENS